MSRPPAAPIDNRVDALHAARTRSEIERRFAVRELPRLLEAGVRGGAALQLELRFAMLEGNVAIDGDLSGSVELTCQRCMRPVTVSVNESLRVVVVSDDSAGPEEYGGYEPIAVEATQLDLRWLTEEQVLLGLPLVPLHEPGECSEASTEAAPVASPELEAPRQQPFGNLRDLLRKH